MNLHRSGWVDSIKGAEYNYKDIRLKEQLINGIDDEEIINELTAQNTREIDSE